MISYEDITARIISREDAGRIFSTSFRGKNTIVFTNGCFDLLHRGHVYYLSRARQMGDLLVVGLNTDASVRRIKGPGRPLSGEQSRAEVLASLVFVDYVILFEQDTPLELILAIRPHILVKGRDYRSEEIVGYNEVLSWGGRVETIPLLEGYSTSSIIRKMGG